MKVSFLVRLVGGWLGYDDTWADAPTPPNLPVLDLFFDPGQSVTNKLIVMWHDYQYSYGQDPTAVMLNPHDALHFERELQDLCPPNDCRFTLDSMLFRNVKVFIKASGDPEFCVSREVGLKFLYEKKISNGV